MIKFRISGDKDSTDVFYAEVNKLVNNKCVEGRIVDKEYLNLDDTIRRYFDINILDGAKNVEIIKSKYSLTVRLSSTNKDELETALDLLKRLGCVFYKPKNNKLYIKKRDKDYSTMVQCVDKHTAAKKKLSGCLNDNLVMF